MAKGFFITGTDTGVGKTVIVAALVKAIGLLGCSVCGMKPIETGCKKTEVRSQKSEVRNDLLIPFDGTFLKKIAGMDDSIDLVTPFTFENPLAPMVASDIEGIPVDIDKIQKAFKELSKKYDVVIIEGIGGLLVPVKKDYFVLDLARDFGLPLIVVSRPGLGTLNHTMLTINYAIKEDLNVAGIIINYTRPPKYTIDEETNPEVIKQISPVPLIGIFPYLKDLESSTIEKAVVKNLDIEIIKKYL
jgi:dethiobiotin synthetase